MFYTSHKRHNRIAEKAGTFFPIRYSEEGKSSRSHPWQVTPVWHIEEKLPSGGYWAAKVNPGLVNGIPAAITMVFEDAPTTAKTRIEEEAKKLNEKKPALTSTHDVFLDEQAEVELVWRRIGADASPTGAVTGDADTGVVTGVFEPVPPFFQALGVASAKTNLLAEPAETTRYLRACDLIVKQPRLAFANEITVGAVVDGSILSANPTFTVPKDRQPRVEALPKFVALAASPTPLEVLVQRFADEPFDQFLLATVYALSAPNEQRPDLLTGGWSIYTHQQVHWNLAHATPRIEERKVFTPLTFFSPLAAGLGNFLINSILAENNDFTQALFDLNQQTNLRGKFYAV